jgi:hypothetical protein
MTTHMITYNSGGRQSWQISSNLVPAADGTWVTPGHLCPDMLRYENIGAADGWRGRTVRAFFWLMRVWSPR